MKSKFHRLYMDCIQFGFAGRTVALPPRVPYPAPSSPTFWSAAKSEFSLAMPGFETPTIATTSSSAPICAAAVANSGFAEWISPAPSSASASSDSHPLSVLSKASRRCRVDRLFARSGSVPDSLCAALSYRPEGCSSPAGPAGWAAPPTALSEAWPADGTTRRRTGRFAGRRPRRYRPAPSCR